MKSFYQYMKKNHAHENSPGNDLLTDMERDEKFPRAETARWKILMHLNKHGACQECIDTFEEYWLSYAHDEGINITALDCKRYVDEVLDILGDIRFDGDEDQAIFDAIDRLSQISDFLDEAV
jgi:uncharacterized protein YozE (UPF0346 family)